MGKSSKIQAPSSKDVRNLKLWRNSRNLRQNADSATTGRARHSVRAVVRLQPSGARAVTCTSSKSNSVKLSKFWFRAQHGTSTTPKVLHHSTRGGPSLRGLPRVSYVSIYPSRAKRGERSEYLGVWNPLTETGNLHLIFASMYRK